MLQCPPSMSSKDNQVLPELLGKSLWSICWCPCEPGKGLWQSELCAGSASVGQGASRASRGMASLICRKYPAAEVAGVTSAGDNCDWTCWKQITPVRSGERPLSLLFLALRRRWKWLGFVIFPFPPATATEQTALYSRAFILSYMLQISIRDLKCSSLQWINESCSSF